MDEIKYWVAINDWVSTFGSLKIAEVLKLVNKFKSLEAVFDAPSGEITKVINNERVANFLEFRQFTKLQTYESEIKHLQSKGINLLTYNDNRYPKMLKQIEDPPLILFHKGALMAFNNCVAIVGTRSPSHVSYKKAREFSREIAQAGYTIVSGLAKGIDTEAHHGALDVSGKTVAVLGTRIDKIYPKENEKIAANITARGALISEAPLLKKWNKLSKLLFVKRNRIISGISQCLLVIESEVRGGTLHQVKYALKQRRKVFVLRPENGDQSSIEGYSKFIKQGGTPCSSSKEIINYLKLIFSNSNFTDTALADFNRM